MWSASEQICMLEHPVMWILDMVAQGGCSITAKTTKRTSGPDENGVHSAAPRQTDNLPLTLTPCILRQCRFEQMQKLATMTRPSTAPGPVVLGSIRLMVSNTCPRAFVALAQSEPVSAPIQNTKTCTNSEHRTYLHLRRSNYRSYSECS